MCAPVTKPILIFQKSPVVRAVITRQVVQGTREKIKFKQKLEKIKTIL